MLIRPLAIPEVIEIVPEKKGDERGFFCETWSRSRFRHAGIDIDWVQDNQSHSRLGHVLRGLHFQSEPHAQDKLVRVLKGSIFDVAVDIRKDSPNFGRWVSTILSGNTSNQLLVPKGFAHGFLTLEAETEVFYKVSAPYAPQYERAIRWDDPNIGIAWPLEGNAPTLSARDRQAPTLKEAVS